MKSEKPAQVGEDNIHPKYMVDIEALKVCKSLITEEEAEHLDAYDGSCDVDE